jgi:hypothetical protein
MTFVLTSQKTSIKLSIPTSALVLARLLENMGSGKLKQEKPNKEISDEARRIAKKESGAVKSR